MANLSGAAHRAALVLQGARGRRAHRRAGLEDQRAPLHDDGQHLRRDLARPAGAQVDDLREPADAARRHRVAARAAPVPRAHRRAVARPRHRDDRAARRAADGQLGAARRHPRAAALGRPQRQPAGRARRPREPRQGPDHGRLAARADGHRRHAAAPAALPGPVRDGLQLLEHLLDLRGRAPVGSRRHRVLAARAAEHGHAERRGPMASARRAPTSSPTARARCPAAPTSTCTTTSTRRPSTRRATPTAAPARPATSRPTTRCATRASRATPTRAPSRSASRSPGAWGRPTRSSTRRARATA